MRRFRTLEQVAVIPEAAVDAQRVVYGGNEDQRRTQGHVCPWWLFPVRLSEWLAAHDALPQNCDLPGMEARLRSCRGDRF